MLSDKYRVPYHWGLLTIIFWILGRNSCGNETMSVVSDCIDTFIINIL